MRNNGKFDVKFNFFQTKCVLLTALILSGMTCYGVVFAPEWMEFCPPKYRDSNENVFSKDATYWYKRRIQFEKSLEKCSVYKGKELEDCYAEIREAEARKNKVWDVRQAEKYRTTEYNRNIIWKN